MFRVHASDRAAALSEQLIRAHQTLRDRLASLREEVAGGTARPAMAGDLVSHCLSFCTAIQTHHTGEDGQLFPALRAAAPGLAAILESHFSFEERRIAASLDTLGPAAWTADVFAPAPSLG